MKKITIYQCEDGTRFDEENEALEYESYAARAKEIESRLVSIGRELEYDEYIQQDPVVVKKAKYDFLTLVAERLPIWKDRAIECRDGLRHISHIQRVIDDYGIKWMQNLDFRLACIDESGREFQQTYFTLHPEEATIRVN